MELRHTSFRLLTTPFHFVFGPNEWGLFAPLFYFAQSSKTSFETFGPNRAKIARSRSTKPQQSTLNLTIALIKVPQSRCRLPKPHRRRLATQFLRTLTHAHSFKVRLLFILIKIEGSLL